MAWQMFMQPVGDYEADRASMVGKVGLVYVDYANALAQSTNGLADVRASNRLTGAVGAAVTQTPATGSAAAAGVEVDVNGSFVCHLQDDADEYWLVFPDSGNPQPRRIVLPRQTDASSSSSSNSSSSSSSNSSSSSSSNSSSST